MSGLDEIRLWVEVSGSEILNKPNQKWKLIEFCLSLCTCTLTLTLTLPYIIRTSSHPLSHPSTYISTSIITKSSSLINPTPNRDLEKWDQYSNQVSIYHHEQWIDCLIFEFLIEFDWRMKPRIGCLSNYSNNNFLERESYLIILNCIQPKPISHRWRWS